MFQILVFILKRWSCTDRLKILFISYILQFFYLSLSFSLRILFYSVLNFNVFWNFTLLSFLVHFSLFTSLSLLSLTPFSISSLFLALSLSFPLHSCFSFLTVSRLPLWGSNNTINLYQNLILQNTPSWFQEKVNSD